MLYLIDSLAYKKPVILISLVLTFIGTAVLLWALKRFLPQDGGRDFALNGKLSKGKHRGAGIIFILFFVAMSLLFVPIQKEYLIYCLLLTAAMLSGYFDDRSKKPWGEYLKGLIDLGIAAAAAWTFTNFNPNGMGFQILGQFIELPKIVYILLATLLIWVSINVTNCTDGVDGLSGSLGIATLLCFFFLFFKQESDYAHIVLLMIACMMGYLWFNVSPSKLLMGDAGSRALGFFIAVLAMKSYNPLLYLAAAYMFIIDGGAGLVKVSLLRFFKIHILKKVRTPIHDYVRQDLGWSDTQVVFRFTAMQLIAILLFV